MSRRRRTWVDYQRDRRDADSWIEACIGAAACFYVGLILFAAMAILCGPQ
jgi:hypothetical protein